LNILKRYTAIASKALAEQVSFNSWVLT